VLPYLISSLVTTLVAGLILMRMRLALWLGVLVVLITSSITLAETATSSTLIHPAVNPGHFGSLAFLFTFALIALVTGTAASIQNYRGPEPGSPGWLSPFVTGVSGLVVGMLVIAIVVAANPVGAAANASANGAPTVHVAGSRFLTNVVLVQKGSTLQVINDDGIEHILENGLWTASGVPDTQVEVGAPSVHSRDLKNGSVEIGPFSTAGIFHIYCTLHRGMNLTVVVQ
jgi:plastocyanin